MGTMGLRLLRGSGKAGLRLARAGAMWKRPGGLVALLG
jgi:hypothetical protein